MVGTCCIDDTLSDGKVSFDINGTFQLEGGCARSIIE